VGGLLVWGAFQPTSDGEELVGAVVARPSGRCALLHGPVVVTEREPLQIAAELVSAVLDHAVAAGAVTVFARPQGLDRIWVRFGFIPVPEGTLPDGLSALPGDGLYAWRGGSAVWSLRRVDTG
jgi:predicted N-acetyltransferase YhbS